jgi:Formin Homology 2 Domain
LRLTSSLPVAHSDGSELSPEQIENIIEFLPTKDERKLLEAYMLEGGQDAAEKFDGLCECEKFMVSMMTVKHAKRKVRALLFKLQFLSCLQSITAGKYPWVLKVSNFLFM